MRALEQLVQRAELDRLRRARLGACRLEPVLEPVVAERALVHAAVAADLALRDHAEGTRGDAVAAPVADVVLDHDRSKLGTRDRTCRADVEAARVRAVLADIAGHQPAEAVVDLLLDERDVPPCVRAQLAGVVVGVAAPHEAVLRHEVPLLARDLARLAADAHARVGEEADPWLDLQAVGGLPVTVAHRRTPPRSPGRRRPARAASAREAGGRAVHRRSPP